MPVFCDRSHTVPDKKVQGMPTDLRQIVSTSNSAKSSHQKINFALFNNQGETDELYICMITVLKLSVSEKTKPNFNKGKETI